MPTLKNTQTNLLKEKIHEKPTHYLDLLFDLLPENVIQAKKILKLMDALVKEKKLDRILLYKQMETPLFFQDKSCQDFTKRDPLISKLIKDGGLGMLNHYLNYKYGAPLSAELLEIHDIFIFNLTPIRTFIDINNCPALASEEDKNRITEKYYSMSGMSYELFGDILQEKSMSILKRLVECHFDFNKQVTIDHLKKYLYAHFDEGPKINNETLQFLLDNGLNPNSYLDLFLNELSNELSIPNITKTQYPLIHIINYLLDNNATLAPFPSVFLEKLHHTLALYTDKINFLPRSQQQQQTLEEIWYLQGQLVETITSLEAAKPYYLKAGKRGINTIKRKGLITLLDMMQHLSNTE